MDDQIGFENTPPTKVYVGGDSSRMWVERLCEHSGTEFMDEASLVPHWTLQQWILYKEFNT